MTKRRQNKKNKKINNQRQKTKKNSCNYNNDSKNHAYEIDNSNYNVNFVVGDYNSVGNEHIYGIERSRSETYSNNEGRRVLNHHRISVDGNENIVDANISKSFNNVNLYFTTLNVFYLVK